MSSVRFIANMSASLLLAILVSSSSQAAGKPNIVFIMADELGYYELSHMGHPHIQTPSIDELAAEGIRFTQGLAGSAVCAPTRCVLMTGKHSGHTSVRTNGGGTPLRAGEVTIASLLSKAGYATGGFGKWGCGGRGSTGVPEQHGFDLFFGYYDQVHAHSYYPPYLVRNSVEVPLPGNKGGRIGETYSHYEIFNQATDFIRRNASRPFFCYLPITPPHGMFDIPADDPAWEIYEDKQWPLEAKRYAAMVSMVDRQVGEVIALLKELSLDENTLVFFCGDNGGNDYFKSADAPRGFHAPNVNPRSGVEFRGRKGTLYEGGLRIPMIARWPGKISPGQVSDHLWYFPDVMPTLAELAGVRCPRDSDGISIRNELLGRADRQQDHEYLYWELGQQIAVRMENWKAIQPSKSADWELYELNADPSEQNNIADIHPQELARLKQFAEQAHEPAVEGTFINRDIHERDRWAKWGTSRQAPAPAGEVQSLPAKQLVPSGELSIVRFSSESTASGRRAIHAIDGKPTTHWHTQFADKRAQHPHELVIDLGKQRELSAIWYLARQDAGFNGTIQKCEISISDQPDQFDDPVISVTLTKTKAPQQLKLKVPVSGRYVRLRSLSEVNGGPWASAAEIGFAEQ
jgi:arylsulfatase A-like enzyme